MSECYFSFNIRYRLYMQLSKSNKFEIFYNAPGVYKSLINCKIPKIFIDLSKAKKIVFSVIR